MKIDGELFTEYLTKAGQSPAMWPVIGPTGKPMTRSYPVGPRGTGRNGRPSASSIALVHARRSERRQLLVAKPQRRRAGSGAHVVHREFVEVESDGKTARIVTRNDWMNDDKQNL